MVPVLGPSEGVDLRLSQTLLPAGRARTLVNWSLEEPGALVMAPGWQHFSTSALGAARVQGGARIYLNSAVPSPSSTIVTLAAWNQALYVAGDTGAWSAAVLSGLSTNEVYFSADRDLVAAFDGSTGRAFKSTNGSSWTAFGLVRPAAPSTVSTLSTGGLSSGEYAINFTYKARGLAVESNGSTAESTITLSASSGAINWTGPNSTNPDINAIVVYARKVSAGETILRKVSSLAQSAGASSTLVITSTAWTINDPIPTDHDNPTGLSFGVVWKNRWWARDATTTNRLKFTQIFQPQSWPALFYIDIPFERGDAIQALIPLGNTLLVFGATKIFIILGQTSLDFEVLPTLASQDGALGPRAACVLENGVIHAGAAGVWIFDGVSDRLLSYDIDPAWRDLITHASAAALARVACLYHLPRKELRVAVPRRYPTDQPGEWILDMSRSRDGKTAWRQSDRDITGYLPWDGPETVAGNRGRLLSWASTQGSLNEESTGYTADGADQTGTYEGPGLTLGEYRGRWVDLRGEYEPNVGSLAIQGVVDGKALPSAAITLGAAGPVYGTAQYGSAIYGGVARKQFYQVLPLSADGRTYVQKFTYRGQGKFKLFSYHPGIVPESRSRSFSE